MIFCSKALFVVLVNFINISSWGDHMESIILAVIIVICLVLNIVCVAKKRPDLIVDFLLRACVGTAAIYLFDFLLAIVGYQIRVGVNEFTILSNGLLGLPGFILLYGLAYYYSI